MFFQIDPSNGVAIYEQVVRQVIFAVAGGALAPGDLVPSVRELARQLAINPNTVTRAYQELLADRVLKTVRGTGLEVAEGACQRCQEERLKLIRRRLQQVFTEARQSQLDGGQLRSLVAAELAVLESGGVKMVPVIRLDEVSKPYGNQWALDKVCLEVPAGTVFALLGENGAGKTTAIRILLGLIDADAGRAEVLGLPSAKQGMEICRRVGYIPEHPTLYDWMTVERDRLVYRRLLWPDLSPGIPPAGCQFRPAGEAEDQGPVEGDAGEGFFGPGPGPPAGTARTRRADLRIGHHGPPRVPRKHGRPRRGRADRLPLQPPDRRSGTGGRHRCHPPQGAPGARPAARSSSRPRFARSHSPSPTARPRLPNLPGEILIRRQRARQWQFLVRDLSDERLWALMQQPGIGDVQSPGTESRRNLRGLYGTRANGPSGRRSNGGHSMNGTIFWRLVWKEYRVQRALWFSIVALTLLLQCLVLLLSDRRDGFVGPLFALPVLMAALYALGCGATLFATERETGTYEFQRSVPVASSTVFWGKVAFALASTAALPRCCGLRPTRSPAPAGRQPSPSGRFGECWGWAPPNCSPGACCFRSSPPARSWPRSLRLRRASSVDHIMAQFVASNCVVDTGDYLRAIPLRLAVLAVVAVADILLGRRWLGKMHGPRWWAGAVELPGIPAARAAIFNRLESTHTRPDPDAAGLAARTTIAADAGGGGGLGPGTGFRVVRVPQPRSWPEIQNNTSSIRLTTAMAALLAALVGVTVFLGDQEQERFRFLAERGVQPTYVWFTRLAVAAPPMLAILCVAVPAGAFAALARTAQRTALSQSLGGRSGNGTRLGNCGAL